jgi:hypothetical protein
MIGNCYAPFPVSALADEDEAHKRELNASDE